MRQAVTKLQRTATMFGLAAAICGTPRLGAAAPPPTVARSATLTVARTAPVVDGKLSPGEWDGALRVAGFQGISPMNALEPRGGASYVAFTRDRLYVAMVSDMPPDGKLHAERSERDSDVVFDESVEIWIDPNRERRESKEGDQSFYQFIGNPLGAILDVRFDPVRGAPDAGWNGRWEFANAYDRETLTWSTEISIPWEDLGWPAGADPVGRDLGLLLARNFKSPWVQATWFRVGGAFSTWSEYAGLKLTADAPVVQVLSLGDDPWTGEIAPRVRVSNPGPARAVTVKLEMTSADMPGRRAEERLELPAGGEALFAYTGGTAFHAHSQHHMTLVVDDAESGSRHLGYSMNWGKLERDKVWTYRVGPNPDAAVRLSAFPSHRLLRLRIATDELGEPGQGIQAGQATLVGPDGATLFAERLAWEGEKTMKEFTLPTMPAGRYALTVTLDGYPDPFRREYERVIFPWEGNTFGITAQVYPPFTPVAVRGREVDVVLRTYRAGGLGLWDSAVSLNRELLAGPIALKVDDGAILEGTGEFSVVVPERRRDGQIVQEAVLSDGQKVVYEGRATIPAVDVRTRCTTEYDGCMKVELTLSPGAEAVPLQRLWLEIPLVEALAPLWHVTTTGLRQNPIGNTPPGEGDVWDSRQFPDGNWWGNFKCYAWLGGEERGIAWFADNDKGWELDYDSAAPEKAVPCLVLNRADGVLTLRVNLVQRPTVIAEPRTIVFGLMASPAKPLLPGWRRMLYNHRRPGYANVQFMGSQYWGSPTNCAAKYPINGDLSVLDKMHEMRLTGDVRGIPEFTARWADCNLPADLSPEAKVPGTEKTRPQMISLVADASLRRMSLRPEWVSVYWEEFHSTYGGHPEMAVFRDEWTGDRTSGTGVLAPSYQDFALWWGAQFLRRGLGLYFDNAFPKRAYDTLCTDAYRLPNGRLQPSAGMWAHREYLKRIWVLHQQLRQSETLALMHIHMTNTHCIPYLSFNESNLDLEWFYGPEPQQSKYPHDLLRAQSIGRQSGNVPFALAEISQTKSPAEKHIAERTRFGTLMVHEIKAYMPGEEGRLLGKVLDFGYGLDDCRVHNYWSDDNPVTADSTAAKTLLLVRGNELLLLVCTWDPRPARVTFAFDEAALGRRFAQAFDAEDERELPMAAANSLVLELAGYDVRLVKLR